jgi:hypothetical protein
MIDMSARMHGERLVYVNFSPERELEILNWIAINVVGEGFKARVASTVRSAGYTELGIEFDNDALSLQFLLMHQ